jgi:hypothetical protein
MLKRVLQDRWTVLSHDPQGTSAKGLCPETWLCVDCGVNTAPGLLTRKEVDLAIAIDGEAKQHMTDGQEVYTVEKDVWRATGLDGMGGCLCIGCLEKRIGRRLRPKDFLPDHPFNSPDFPATRRLRKRRGEHQASPR